MTWPALSRREGLALGAILALAALLRLAGLGWGVPRYTPELAAGNPARTSFHPDEDKILRQLVRMDLLALDLDTRDFGWGTLHTYLVGPALMAAEAAGAFGERGWRAAFAGAHEPYFTRVFAVARAVSALFGIATVGLVFLAARDLGGTRAGLWAAALLAASPLHVLHSHYLTTDATLTFLLLAALRASLASRSVQAALLGGLALATKQVAVMAVPLWLLPARTRRDALRLAGALVGGFLLGEPYAVFSFVDWLARTAELGRAVTWSRAEAIPVWSLVVTQAWQVAVYGLAPVAAALGLVGLRRAPMRLRVLAGILAATLVVLRFPMSRYVLPVLPLLAVCAGLVLARLHGVRLAAAAALALLPPFALAAAVVGTLRRPHPAQLAADWLDATAPGASVATLWEEIPLLDLSQRRREPLVDPFGLEGRPFTAPTADRVVLDDLPIHAWRPELIRTLATDYRLAAVFTSPPRLFGVVLPEPIAAHDWRYGHPVIAVYEKTNEAPRMLDAPAVR
jgi:hypothetical protein